VAYRLTKFQDQVEEDEPASYDVCIDPTNPQRGEHHCCCKGQQRWGHRHPCKHIRSLLALNAKGLLPTLTNPAPVCEVCEKAPAVAGKECLRCSDTAACAQLVRDGLDDVNGI
jgi:hypothetical protein